MSDWAQGELERLIALREEHASFVQNHEPVGFNPQSSLDAQVELARRKMEELDKQIAKMRAHLRS